MFMIRQTHHIRHFCELMAVLACLAGGFGVYHHFNSPDNRPQTVQTSGQKQPAKKAQSRQNQPGRKADKKSDSLKGQARDEADREQKKYNGKLQKAKKDGQLKKYGLRAIIIVLVVAALYGMFSDDDDGGGAR